MYLFRRLFLVAGCVVVTLLTGCKTQQHPSARVEIRAPELSTTSTTVDRAAMRTLWLAEAKQRDDIARFSAAAIKNAAAVQSQTAEERCGHGLRSSAASSATTRCERSVGTPMTHSQTGTVAAPIVLNAGSCGQLLEKYFGDVLPWAQRVTHRESHCSAVTNYREGCDTSGKTNSHAVGPWQICYPQHQAAFDAVGCNAPLDLECNMKAARYIYDSEGAGPWGG